MRDFKKYEIWKLSHKLTLDIYELTNDYPKNEIYGLTSQIRRACSSIPTNISEGCGRDSDAEFNRFLTIALGSANETEYLIILSKDLNYITEEKSVYLLKQINLIKRKTYQLKQKLIA
ncbi:four helix bundle protein [Lutibacter sp. A80]|uniref:four helix bundle protein n=1 Tax=Lutibacter sp. A80 TaxID=2918453 RepID=UPI001F0564AD|nr:four helix bundle protein [Lutibacter sp. A80]UMB60317.1 four helix bundle protein [Lutibacter sp. A80]